MPVTTSPTRSPTRWSATGSTSPTRRPASCSTATRARRPRSRSSTAWSTFTGHKLDAAVVLTVDADVLVARLLQRAQTEGRADDTEEVIRRRQEVYAEQTEPLIDLYRERGILVEVDGMGAVDEVTTRIFTALDVWPQS